MIKNTFIYVVIFILVGIAVWFFVNKARNASQVADISSLGSDQSSPTPILSVAAVKDGENWIKLDNGLEYQDIVVGSGKEAQLGDIVAAHYSGTLVNGQKFDSSYDREEPFAFILGGGMVIKGWDIGVAGMKVGGKRKLIIPSDLGYGERGAGGAIPPNATLLFDIELVAVQTPEK